MIQPLAPGRLRGVAGLLGRGGATQSARVFIAGGSDTGGLLGAGWLLHVHDTVLVAEERNDPDLNANPGGNHRTKS